MFLTCIAAGVQHLAIVQEIVHREVTPPANETESHKKIHKLIVEHHQHVVVCVQGLAFSQEIQYILAFLI